MFDSNSEFVASKDSLEKPWVTHTKTNVVYLRRPKFLYGSDDPEDEMIFDTSDFYSFDGTYIDEDSGKNIIKNIK